ncbi:MAG: type II toxin-antitoxin system HicB family antitoxin [Planctomycetota bacterium]|nr:type II toxin-antitoxin system HicB family antitoxin [Planctomycetota bacterium]
MKESHESKTSRIKVIIEHAEDGYIAYPLGMKGVVIGQGDTYEEALADVKSAIQAHLREFGSESLQPDSSAIEAFIAEAEVAV